MPSLSQTLVTQLSAAKEYFDRSTRALEEADSTFAPRPEMLSVAQQVAHVAQTIDWFREGMLRPEGFNMNFEEHMADVMKVSSLSSARAWHQRAHDAMVRQISDMSDSELTTPLPDTTIMGGAPRSAVVSGIDDHTAHHRGALTVYARLLGKVPPMPYMDL